MDRAARSIDCAVRLINRAYRSQENNIYTLKSVREKTQENGMLTIVNICSDQVT